MMVRTVLVLFFALAFSGSYAQRSVTILYRSKGHLSTTDLKNLFVTAQEERKKNGVEIMDSVDESTLEQSLTELLDMIPGGLNEERKIYREGNFVMISKPNQLHKVNLKTLERTVIDSTHYQLLKRLDTSIHEMLNTAFIYTLEKTKEVRNIAGYTCEKFILKETDPDPSPLASRILTIWATRQIKPAIPVFAVEGLHKIMLEDYTPLKVSENLAGTPNSGNETEAIILKKH